jgi:hypothetical protein
MLSGFLEDRNCFDNLNLSSSCLSFGTLNKTLMSRSASFLYLFVSIEPIRPILITGYSFSKSSICLSMLVFALSFSEELKSFD